MPGRDTVPFSTEAMKASLLRLQNEWETVQASREGCDLSISNRRLRTRCAGRRRARQSSMLIGRCTCEGFLRSESRNRSLRSFFVPRIVTRWMTGRAASGRGRFGTRQNSKTEAPIVSSLDDHLRRRHGSFSNDDEH